VNFLLILEDIKAYWHFFVIGLLFVLLCFQHAHVAYLKIEISKLNLRIDQQNAAVLEWKREAELQTKKMKAAEIEAKKIRKEYQIQFKKTFQGPVPQQCEKVIEWGIEQAKGLN
jgi:hypothetical protein